jgi:hypothetical protein
MANGAVRADTSSHCADGSPLLTCTRDVLAPRDMGRYWTVRLITPRSQVQILPPLRRKPLVLLQTPRVFSRLGYSRVGRFFPRSANRWDLVNLDDTDRRNTKNLYRLMFDTFADFQGSLQLIAFDHADFNADWFQDCVVERWREGVALVPPSWLEDETP